MIELRRFHLYYFSEVSADLLYRYRPEYDTYKISATHTHDRVPISDWFHFTDITVPERNDPLYFESSGPIEPLAKMADKLSPGAEHILEQRDVCDPRRQFFSDFMSALYEGEYSIYGDRATEYIHDSGDWLLEVTERFK